MEKELFNFIKNYQKLEHDYCNTLIELFLFIKELKDNQKVNQDKNLENRIDIDYVIERLYLIGKGSDNDEQKNCI